MGSMLTTVFSMGLAVLGCESALGDSFTFTAIDIPGVTLQGRAINNSGQIVGTAYDANGIHGFLYSGGTLTLLDIPGESSSQAYAIDNSGRIIVQGQGDSFLYAGGAYSPITLPGPPEATRIYGIDDNGDLAGDLRYGNDGVYEKAGTFFALDDPNGTSGTTLVGINDSGQIAGTWSNNNNFSRHSFVYDGNAFIDVSDPLATGGTVVSAMNASGELVGLYIDPNGGRAFVDNGGVFTTIDVPNAYYGTQVFGINDLGQIVGTYSDNDGTHLFVGAPTSNATTPEPAGILLCGIGLALLRLHRKR